MSHALPCRICGKPVAIRTRLYCSVACEIEAGQSSSDEEILPLKAPHLQRVPLKAIRRTPKSS